MSTATLDDRGVIVTCPTCGKRNRVPFGRQGKCGSCGSLLRAPGEPIESTERPGVRRADQGIVRAGGRRFLGAMVWSMPHGRPRIAEGGPEPVRKVGGREGEHRRRPELGERFVIQSIPTMAVFRKAGKSRERPAHGLRPTSKRSSVTPSAGDADPGGARDAVRRILAASGSWGSIGGCTEPPAQSRRWRGDSAPSF